MFVWSILLVGMPMASGERAVTSPPLPISRLQTTNQQPKSEIQAGAPNSSKSVSSAKSSAAETTGAGGAETSPWARKISLPKSRTTDVQSAEQPEKPPSQATWWWSTAIGLVIVLSVIYLGSRALRKMVPGMAGTDSIGPIQVLFRTFLAPKQTACLVRCGDRLLLIGLSGDQMHTLAEITDPQEIDWIKGQCMQVRPTSATQAFREIFRGKDHSLGPKLDEEEPELEHNEKDQETVPSEELSKHLDNMREKVLAWKVENGT